VRSAEQRVIDPGGIGAFYVDTRIYPALPLQRHSSV
jgi:hypothetical protein